MLYWYLIFLSKSSKKHTPFPLRTGLGSSRQTSCSEFWRTLDSTLTLSKFCTIHKSIFLLAQYSAFPVTFCSFFVPHETMNFFFFWYHFVLVGQDEITPLSCILFLWWESHGWKIQNKIHLRFRTKSVSRDVSADKLVSYTFLKTFVQRCSNRSSFLKEKRSRFQNRSLIMTPIFLFLWHQVA